MKCEYANIGKYACIYIFVISGYIEIHTYPAHKCTYITCKNNLLLLFSVLYRKKKKSNLSTEELKKNYMYHSPDFNCASL